MITINSTLLNLAKLFLLFTIANTVFVNVNLYQARYIEPTLKELAKYNFYLLGIFWILNILVTMTYTIGINKYGLPVWVVNIIYWGAAVIPTLLMTYLWFKQLPNLTQLIGVLLVLSGIMLVVAK